MQLRRPRSHRSTLLAAGLLLASPLLSSCGFDYATDRVNTISAGINDRDGDVDVLGAVVIAGEDDLGLFVATLVNNDQAEPIDLDGIQPNDTIQPLGDAQPLEVAAGDRVSLFQTGGVEVGGSFTAGDFVPVTLSFSNGQVTTVTVSVVPPCHQYSLDKLTELTLPSAGAGEEPTEEPAGEVTAETDATEEEATEDEFGPYSCEALPAVDHHAEGGEAEGAEGAEGTEGEGAE